MKREPRPRLAQAFTILTSADTVRLVAGEDARYTLRGSGIEGWLPALLQGLRGGPLSGVLETVPEERRGAARALIERLYGERVVVDGVAETAGREGRSFVAEGQVEWLGLAPGEALDGARVLVQDRLDYAALREWNRRCLQGDAPFLWVSGGAQSRGYVGPLHLPSAGPCAGCMLTHFRRLSPAPEIYDELEAHAAAGGAVTPVELPGAVIGVLREIMRWKLAAAALAQAPAALFRLHVVSAASLEVSVHRVYRDPECGDCRDCSG